MSGKYKYRGFVISNMGYYKPDHHVWWEGVEEKTGEACYHGKTLREVMSMIDEDILRDEIKAKMENKTMNAVKMREALVRIRQIAKASLVEKRNGLPTSNLEEAIINHADAALAEPPRNCDRPEIKTLADAIAAASKEIRKPQELHDAAYSPGMFVAAWLLAEATAKEGEKA